MIPSRSIFQRDVGLHPRTDPFDQLRRRSTPDCIVNLITATTTKTGLAVSSRLDERV
jgi:hypothetical protein